MDHDRARALIEQQFAEGPLVDLQAQALRVHLRACESCRGYYDKLSTLESTMERAPVAGAQLERMRALGAPEIATETAAPAKNRWVKFAPLLAAAAALLLFVVLPKPKENDLQSRGGGADAKKAWVSVYRFHDGATSRLGETLSAQDALLFAYSNDLGSPYRYLAIAGLDAKGRAHWYHPAYTSAGQTPKSIAIESEVADRELPERIRARHAPGPLKICALFTKEPLDINGVDAELERTKTWPDSALTDCRDVEVRP